MWRILAADPKLTLMMDEPFNEHFATWAPGNPDYLGRVISIDAFDRVVDELFETYRGIKVLDYQLDEEQLTHLILRPDVRVIYIRRQNLLQTAVSDRIAKQTQVWNRWDLDPAKNVRDRYEALQPLDLDDLRTYVQDLQRHLVWIDSVLARRDNPPPLQMRYEDLFCGAAAAQQYQLAKLWAYLGLTPVTSPTVDRYLDPRRAKLGSAHTYGRLPNAAEIDLALGSNETGYLLPFT